MIAFLVAAGLSAGLSAKPVLIEASPLITTPAACREKMELARDEAPLKPRRLGELPVATAEYAVMRKVEGCMVPAPMSLNRNPFTPEGGR